MKQFEKFGLQSKGVVFKRGMENMLGQPALPVFREFLGQGVQRSVGGQGWEHRSALAGRQRGSEALFIWSLSDARVVCGRSRQQPSSRK